MEKNLKKKILCVFIGVIAMLFSGCSKKNKDTHYFYSEKELDKLEEYISASYGKIEFVFHEIESPDIHLDVMVIKPSEDQPYYKLVTMGAGAYKMNVPRELKSYNLERAEYVIFLPKDWDIESKTDEGYWPIGNLKMVGRLALNTDSWLGYGHTISANEDSSPVASNTEFNSFVLLGSIGVDNQIVEPLSLGIGKKINFYQLYPLYQEELEFKLENSIDDLCEKIDEKDLDFVVNINRKNYCK